MGISYDTCMTRVYSKIDDNWGDQVIKDIHRHKGNAYGREEINGMRCFIATAFQLCFRMCHWEVDLSTCV
jgi:hypothetical protein